MARRPRTCGSAVLLVVLSLLLGSPLAARAEEAPVGSDGSAPPAPSASAAPKPKDRDAAKLLAAGDREFRDKKFDAAVRLYGESLAALTLGAAAAAAADGAAAAKEKADKLRFKALYARHKALIPQEKFGAAIADLAACIELDAAAVLPLLQRANLQLLTGKCAEAAADYERVLALDASKRDAHSRLPHARECAQALARADNWAHHRHWQGVRDEITNAVAENRATHAPALLLRRAEAQLKIGGESELESALGDLARVLKMDGNNLVAYALRGRALYAHGDYATARAHFQECLQLDPEHSECKAAYRQVKAVEKAKSLGENGARDNRWADAVAAWQSGLAADGQTGVWVRTALPALARAQLRAGDKDGAVATARRAQAIDDGLAEPHAVLAEVLLGREEFDEAVREAKAAHERDRGSGDIQQLLQRCEAALKQSKTKDYYKILGVSRSADAGEIKRAYRKLALEWHPDKVEAERKDEAVKRFQDIGEAYEVLSDDEKKGRYDRGEDVNGQPQQQGHPGGFPGGASTSLTFFLHFPTPTTLTSGSPEHLPSPLSAVPLRRGLSWWRGRRIQLPVPAGLIFSSNRVRELNDALAPPPCG